MSALGVPQPSTLGRIRSEPMPKRAAWWALAFVLSCTLTVTNQVWVGGYTIYAGEWAPERARLHQAILSNRLPDGFTSWTSIGANGSNVRVLVVWAAEGIHRATGQSLRRVYWAIETAGLLVCCCLLFALMMRCTGAEVALAGLLYFGSVLPLTYLFHYFHPWDRPALAMWLAALICTHQRRWALLAGVLAIGMLVKYDIIIFPAFVLLVEVPRVGWRRGFLRATPFLALTLTLYLALKWAIPGGFEPRPWWAMILHNFDDMRTLPFAYPPALGLLLPVTLALVGYSRSDNFARAGVLTGALYSAILFLQVNFRELRGEMAVLALVMPAAAVGVRRLLGTDAVRSGRIAMPGEARVSA
jgi:hypothetical protein